MENKTITAENRTAKISPVYQEILEELNGSEVRSMTYEDVVGVQGNQVIRNGKVIDILDEDKKISCLWDEYVEQEGLNLEGGDF